MHVFAEHRRRARGRLSRAASLLTTPLLPDDFLGLVNPLWSRRQPAGRVVAVRRETAESATLAIRPGFGWREHRAGQHVSVGVEIDGVRHQRSYSLTSPPGADDRCIAITVKAVRGGVVSSHLVHRTRPGDVVHLGEASGEFVLPADDARPLLFISAGSGVTPVMGMLRTLQRSDALRDVAHVHIDREPDSVIFAGELRGLAGRRRLALHEHHTAHHGRPSAEQILGRVRDWQERETWACGPAAMLDRLEAHYAASGAHTRLRTERFCVGRLPAGASSSAPGGRVTFTRSGVAVDSDGATTLLAAGEAAGALLPSGCRAGICRRCVAPLREGVVRDIRTGDVCGVPGDVIQTCVSVAAGPVEVEL